MAISCCSGSTFRSRICVCAVAIGLVFAFASEAVANPFARFLKAAFTAGRVARQLDSSQRKSDGDKQTIYLAQDKARAEPDEQTELFLILGLIVFAVGLAGREVWLSMRDKTRR